MLFFFTYVIFKRRGDPAVNRVSTYLHQHVIPGYTTLHKTFQKFK